MAKSWVAKSSLHVASFDCIKSKRSYLDDFAHHDFAKSAAFVAGHFRAIILSLRFILSPKPVAQTSIIPVN
jgi:hypothetical protein